MVSSFVLYELSFSNNSCYLGVCINLQSVWYCVFIYRNNFMDPSSSSTIISNNKHHHHLNNLSTTTLITSTPQAIFSLGCKGRGKGEFLNPQDVAIDCFRRIFVTDSINQCIQVFEGTMTHFENAKCVAKIGDRGKCNVGVKNITTFKTLNSHYILNK